MIIKSYPDLKVAIESYTMSVEFIYYIEIASLMYFFA